MQLRSASEREWVERPVGRMGRCELRELVLRLQRIPRGTESIHIEWNGVTHLDFRGLAELAGQMRRIIELGIAVRCTGFSPYLSAILRFALSLDEIEMFETFGDEPRRSRWTQGSPNRARLGDHPSFHPSAN